MIDPTLTEQVRIIIQVISFLSLLGLGAAFFLAGYYFCYEMHQLGEEEAEGDGSDDRIG